MKVCGYIYRLKFPQLIAFCLRKSRLDWKCRFRGLVSILDKNRGCRYRIRLTF